MAKFRFIGQYTNGQTSINGCGVTFVEHEPAEVTDEEAIRRLSHNPEFDEVKAAPDAESAKPAPKAKRKAKAK